jgi:hypothetical protein
MVEFLRTRLILVYMKQLAAFIAVVCVSVLVYAAPGNNTWTDTQYGFTITFPDGWRLTHTGKPVVTALNPQENNAVNMNVIVSDPKFSNAIIKQAGQIDLMAALKEKHLDMMFAASIPHGFRTLGGIRAVWLRPALEQTIDGAPVCVASYQVWTVYHNKVFTITAAALSDTPAHAQARFNTYEKAVMQSIDSFTFAGRATQSAGLALLAACLCGGLLLILRFFIIKKPFKEWFA